MTLADKVHPNDPRTLVNLGIVLAALERPKDAIQKYARAHAVRPTHADTLYNWGAALIDLGRPEPASVKFSEADARRGRTPNAASATPSFAARRARSSDLTRCNRALIAVRDMPWRSARLP